MSFWWCCGCGGGGGNEDPSPPDNDPFGANGDCIIYQDNFTGSITFDTGNDDYSVVSGSWAHDEEAGYLIGYTAGTLELPCSPNHAGACNTGIDDDQTGPPAEDGWQTGMAAVELMPRTLEDEVRLRAVGVGDAVLVVDKEGNGRLSCSLAGDEVLVNETLIGVKVILMLCWWRHFVQANLVVGSNVYRSTGALTGVSSFAPGSGPGARRIRFVQDAVSDILYYRWIHTSHYSLPNAALCPQCQKCELYPGYPTDSFTWTAHQGSYSFSTLYAGAPAKAETVANLTNDAGDVALCDTSFALPHSIRFSASDSYEVLFGATDENNYGFLRSGKSLIANDTKFGQANLQIGSVSGGTETIEAAFAMRATSASGLLTYNGSSVTVAFFGPGEGDTVFLDSPLNLGAGANKPHRHPYGYTAVSVSSGAGSGQQIGVGRGTVANIRVYGAGGTKSTCQPAERACVIAHEDFSDATEVAAKHNYDSDYWEADGSSLKTKTSAIGTNVGVSLWKNTFFDESTTLPAPYHRVTYTLSAQADDEITIGPVRIVVDDNTYFRHPGNSKEAPCSAAQVSAGEEFTVVFTALSSEDNTLRLHPVWDETDDEDYPKWTTGEAVPFANQNCVPHVVGGICPDYQARTSGFTVEVKGVRLALSRTGYGDLPFYNVSTTPATGPVEIREATLETMFDPCWQKNYQRCFWPFANHTGDITLSFEDVVNRIYTGDGTFDWRAGRSCDGGSSGIYPWMQSYTLSYRGNCKWSYETAQPGTQETNENYKWSRIILYTGESRPRLYFASWGTDGTHTEPGATSAAQTASHLYASTPFSFECSERGSLTAMAEYWSDTAAAYFGENPSTFNPNHCDKVDLCNTTQWEFSASAYPCYFKLRLSY